MLYAWATTPKSLPASTDLVPSEPVAKPVRPEEDAPLADWRDYYLRMAALVEWQMDVEQWRGSVESRLEGLEAVTDLIPEILERLPPQTLTLSQQRAVQNYARQLHEATGKAYGTIYEDMKMAFDVPKYSDISESEWDKVVKWFNVQIERGRKK